jgi:hypothetical protein
MGGFARLRPRARSSSEKKKKRSEAARVDLEGRNWGRRQSREALGRRDRIRAMAGAAAYREQGDGNRGGEPRRHASAEFQPVYFGFRLTFVFGRLTMKCVEATILSTLAREAGLSKASTAGVIPKSWRIQAA